MKFEISEKDKKLLLGLAIVVIIVCIGYWGIRPVISSITEINNKTEEEQTQKDLNEIKIAQLPLLQSENDELEVSITEAKQDFYDIMTSNEIDKLLTDMALGYNLYSYDLEIEMPNDTTTLEAYQYSKKAITDTALKDSSDTQASDTATTESDETTSLGEFANEAEGEAADSDTSAADSDNRAFTGIYTVNVTMRLGGTEADLEGFIEGLSKNDKTVRISSYIWSDSRNINYNEDGTYDISMDKVLTVKLEIYMCSSK